MAKGAGSIPPSVGWKASGKLVSSAGSQFPQLQSEINGMRIK